MERGARLGCKVTFLTLRSRFSCTQRFLSGWDLLNAVVYPAALFTLQRHSSFDPNPSQFLVAFFHRSSVAHGSLENTCKGNFSRWPGSLSMPLSFQPLDGVVGTHLPTSRTSLRCSGLSETSRLVGLTRGAGFTKNSVWIHGDDRNHGDLCFPRGCAKGPFTVAPFAGLNGQKGIDLLNPATLSQANI